MEKAITNIDCPTIFLLEKFTVLDSNAQCVYSHLLTRARHPESRLRARLSTASIVRSPSSRIAKDTARSAIAFG